MQIDGIDYCVTLLFYDVNNTIVKEMNFSDFYEVNKFVVENPYIEYNVFYTFCEMIDGEPDGYSWEKPMNWKVLTDREIQFEIEDYVRWYKEEQVHWKKVDDRTKEIHYGSTTLDYKSKQIKLKDYAYVCPKCLHEVEHCMCAIYPGYLVQIDRLMLPIIEELNQNGYETTSCCAGHPDSEDYLIVYISFVKEYDFDEPFPVGGKYSKLRHSLSYEPPADMPKKEYTTFQKRILDELLEWAENLVPHCDDDEFED